MLSRTAERLYWFARQIERTENTARLMLVQHQLVLDLPASIKPNWSILSDALGTSKQFRETYKRESEKNNVTFVFGDKTNPGSIISSLTFARENIRTTREIMPAETWERVNSLFLSVAQRANKDLTRKLRFKVLNEIIQRCQQITGMLSGSMSHGEAYQFLRIGRNLERADMTTRIIDTGTSRLLGNDEDIRPYCNSLWISVLKSLSAYQMYRLDAQINIEREEVLNFLFHNTRFPRALAHTIGEIERSIELLPKNRAALKSVRRVKKHLSQIDVSGLTGKSLHQFIDEVQLQLDGIHQTIHQSWFAPFQEL